MKNQRSLQFWAIMDIVMLPVFLYTYGILEVLFWIILILYDSFTLSHMDMKQLLRSMSQPQNAQQRHLLIYSLCYVVALGVVAFKNFNVAGVLLGNELLMTLVAFINMTKEDKK